jgi:hypothetical protein
MLVSLVVTGLVIELATRYGVPLVSRYERRNEQERRAAVSLGRETSRSRIAVLFLGNSLTGTDIDIPLMQQRLGPRFQVTRWMISDTNYLDWYFALRGLFRDGARPQVVVVGARPANLVSSRVREHYFASHLIRRLDLPDLAAAAARTYSDPTTTSDMVVDNLSAFYGIREEINKRLLSWVVPGFPRLAGVFSGPPPSVHSDGDIRGPAPARLSELKALCAAHGARLVVWIAPTPQWQTNADSIAAGNQAGVEVVAPGPLERIPPDRFPDGMHMDEPGARQWTETLALRLRPLLSAPPCRIGTPTGQKSSSFSG